VLAVQQSLIVTHRDGRDLPILPMSGRPLVEGYAGDVLSCRDPVIS